MLHRIRKWSETTYTELGKGDHANIRLLKPKKASGTEKSINNTPKKEN